MKPVRYHILLSLAAGPRHGAEIRRTVVEQSRGAVTLYPAMLYGTLDELVDTGWIEEADAPAAFAEQSRWRFYALTPAGASALDAETARLESVVAEARAALRTV